MRNMLERVNKTIRKSSDKGFSLVELIIVIAIMAALIAILAPQYTKYVEQSRQSVDISAADTIVGAVKTVGIDPTTYDAAKTDFTVTWATGGGVTVTAGDNASTDLNKAIQAIVGATVAPKSKACQAADTTFEYDGDTGSVTVKGGAVTAGGAW